MKIIFNLVVLSFFTLTTNAQTAPVITLKPNGFVGPDTTKNYIVIEFPKASKIDLYNKTLTWLNSVYKNPSKVLSVVEGESIMVSGYTEEIKGNLNWYKYPMKYNIKLQFKDGKIRFEPTITELLEEWASNKPPRVIYINSADSPNKSEVNCIYMTLSGKTILFKKDLKEAADKWVNSYAKTMVDSFSDNW